MATVESLSQPLEADSNSKSAFKKSGTQFFEKKRSFGSMAISLNKSNKLAAGKTTDNIADRRKSMTDLS